MATHTLVVKFLQLSTRGAAYAMKANQLQSELTSKKYHYYTDRDDVKVDDYCVVWSPIFDAPALVQVVEVLWNTKTDWAFKYIIDKVDFTEYNRVMAEKAALAEARRIREQQKQHVQQELKAFKQRAEAAFIESYLEQNPEYVALKAQLKSLEGDSIEF
jgi:hypothetical protein